MAKARYLGKVIELAEKIEAETVSCQVTIQSHYSRILQGQDGSNHYLVQAKLAILSKQFKQAEAILLERVRGECCYIRIAQSYPCFL